MDIRRIVEATLVPHPVFESARLRVKQCFAYSKNSPEPICLALLGESRTGKSRVLEEARTDVAGTRTSEGAVVPTLYVKVPSNPTVKGLAEMMLHALGDPKWSVGTENNKSLRLQKQMLDSGTQMLMVDEFHHFVDKHSHKVFHGVTDWLKILSDGTKVALVVAGLETCKAVLLQNEQLSGRFLAPIILPRFNWQQAIQRRDFEAILLEFTCSLSEHFDIPALHTEEMGFRMWCATGGLIGYLTKLLRQAVWNALDAGVRTITFEDLDAAYQGAIWNVTETTVVPQPFSREFSTNPAPELIARVLTVGVRQEPDGSPLLMRRARAFRSEPLSRILAATGA